MRLAVHARPALPTGHVLVIAVEDVSAAVRAHPPAGTTGSAAAYSPSGTPGPAVPCATWGQVPLRAANASAPSGRTHAGAPQLGAGSAASAWGAGGGLQAAALAAAGGPEGAEPQVVAPPCLEWLRQLLDTGSLVGEGARAGTLRRCVCVC